jgi:hypothetical protein
MVIGVTEVHEAVLGYTTSLHRYFYLCFFNPGMIIPREGSPFWHYELEVTNVLPHCKRGCYQGSDIDCSISVTIA